MAISTVGARGLPEDGHPGHTGKQPTVGKAVLAPTFDHLVEAGELGAPQGRQEVGEAVVLADVRVFVVDYRLACLGREVANPVCELDLVG